MTALIDIALSQYGQVEIPGKEHNPEILKYFSATDSPASLISDETSWCSAFVNWCAKEAGLERTNKLNARSWLSIGTPTDEPQMGDIVIYWRESKNSWKGHVGIFINKINDEIWTLGGNQGNRVSIVAYPDSRLLGYRTLNSIL